MVIGFDTITCHMSIGSLCVHFEQGDDDVLNDVKAMLLFASTDGSS